MVDKKEYAKKYKAENRDKIAAAQRKYCAENKDKVAAAKKKYYAENKDKVSASKKKYYAENREALYQKKQARISQIPDYYKKERIQEVARINSDKNVYAGRKFNDQKSGAKIRKIEWNLDKASTILLIAEARYCALSGIRLSHKISNRHAPSIDRINSSKGYVPGNIQIVSTIVNQMKNVLTNREFKSICKKVVGK